jgi:uncharacterized protein YfcZ (UPF0381/DUF406 family)
MSNASDTPLAEKIAAIEKALKRARVLMSGKNPSPSFNAMLTLRNEVEEAMPALTSLAKDVAAMEEATSKLLRTEDGVLIVPGMTLYRFNTRSDGSTYWNEHIAVMAADTGDYHDPHELEWSEYSSTRAAALAAAAKGQDTV